MAQDKPPTGPVVGAVCDLLRFSRRDTTDWETKPFFHGAKMLRNSPVPSIGFLGFGLISTAAAACCIVLSPRSGLTGWLTAAMFLQSIPVGALMLLAAMRLGGGQRDAELRCVTEAASGLWIIALLAFLPVLLGQGMIYDRSAVTGATAWESAWHSPLPFVLRTLLWFVVLAAIACSQVGGRASKSASALALIVLTLGASLTGVDWLSFDRRFQTPAEGLTIFALEMCVASAVVLLLRLSQPPRPARSPVSGGLLLLLLMIWLYFQAMPYLASWPGNVLQGANWYLDRGGLWTWVACAAGALSIVPLLALLLPAVRSSPRALALAALCVLAGKVLEFAWISIPGRGVIAAVSYALALGGLGSFGVAYLSPGRLPLWVWRSSAA